MQGLGAFSGLGRDLKIRFIADVEGALRRIDRLYKKIQKVQDVSTIGMGKRGFLKPFVHDIGQGPYSFQNLPKKFQAIGNAGNKAFGKIKGSAVAAGIAIIGVAYALKKAFQFGAIAEGAFTNLKVLQGSAEKARKTIQEAVQFSIRTPFTPTETYQAAATTSQYGIDMFKKGVYGLKADQNVAQILAGLGSFTDIQGKLFGINRAAHAILRGDYRLLRQHRGIIQPAYEAALKQGKVGTSAFRIKFIEELGKIPQIMQLAEEKSRTMVGIWSTIKGFFEIFWTKFSGALEEEGILTLWSQFKDILWDIRNAGIKIIEYLGPFFIETGAMIGTAFKTVWDILKQIGRIAGPILVPAFQIIIQIIRGVYSILTFVLQTLVKIIKLIANLLLASGGFLDKMSNGAQFLKRIVDEVTEFVTGLQILFMFIGIFIDGIFKDIEGGFDKTLQQISDAVTFIIEQFKRLINFLTPYVDKLKNIGGEMISPIKDIPGYEKAKGIISKVKKSEVLEKVTSTIAAPFTSVLGEAKQEVGTVIKKGIQRKREAGINIQKTYNINSANEQDLYDALDVSGKDADYSNWRDIVGR